MTERSIITLLTDFGLQDIYVGVMKGIIAQISPYTQMIDLTHQIPPQNLLAGRFSLMNAYTYFPQGTVHLAVIDPEVGGERKGVAIRFREGYLVGPDNGIFSGVLSLSPAISAVSLTNSHYWRIPNPSTTFHGRDIFAPVAAYLAQGLPLEVFGEMLDPDSLVQLAIDPPEISENQIIGNIQSIDIFGNLITNIPVSVVVGKNWALKLGEKIIPHQDTYSQVSVGEIVTLIGSHGWVEIAINSGNAQTELRLNYGDKITVINVNSG